MFKKANFSIRSFFARTNTTSQSQTKVLKNAKDFESLYCGVNHQECFADITQQQVKQAIQAANSGVPVDLVYLLEEVIEKDGTIAAHLQTRTLAITGKPWSITSRKFQTEAKEVELMLKQMDTHALIASLLQAVIYGFAGVVLDWENGGGKLSGFEPIHPGCFDFSKRAYVSLFDADGKSLALCDFAEYQFLFVRYRHLASLPSADGIGRSLLWLYLMKKNGMRTWSRFIEKYGIPMLLGKLPTGSSSEEAQQLLRSLSRMAKEGVAVSIGDDSTLETLESAKSANDHERYCRYIDELITITILGQLATSDRSSGTSNGNIQGAVRNDIMLADARFVMQSIQKSIINPWLKMKYGLESEQHDIEFWIDCQPVKDLCLYADLCLKLATASNATLDKTWVENEFNVKFNASQ